MTYGTNAPNGLVPINTGVGSTFNGQTTRYAITATYASAMFTGDTCTLGTAGTVIQSVASQAVLGVFFGCEYQISSNKYQITWPYWPGNPGVVSGTQPYAFVIDDPMVRFSVQEASTAGASGTPLTQAVVGNNGDIVLSTGNTTTGISRAFLSNQSTATTLLGNVKIVGLDLGITLGVNGTGSTNLSGGPQTINSAFNNWIVQLNNGVFKAGSTRP